MVIALRTPEEAQLVPRLAECFLYSNNKSVPSDEKKFKIKPHL